MRRTDELSAALTGMADPEWFHRALGLVAAEPESIAELFPAVGRHCGRGQHRPATPADSRQPQPELADWSIDDAARVLLLRSVPLHGSALAEIVESLYRFGDAHEKRGVLAALPTLDMPADMKRVLLDDAIRTNDSRLLAAALGPAAACLPAPMWRQAVLKCVFTGVPLQNVADLDARADAELATMLDGLVRERQAAGRTVPDDAMALLRRLTTATDA
jgi:hypothetical protein